jgi:hypothetical protein
MANRHKSYDDILVPKFENIEYAQAYLLNIVTEEKLPIDEALRETIKAMSLGAFAQKSGQSIQAVSDFVSKRQKWSSDKLIKIIDQAFSLKVKLSFDLSDEDEVA